MYHCDIKPDNIMLDKEFNMYLIDIDSFSDKPRDSFSTTSTYSPCIIFLYSFYYK